MAGRPCEGREANLPSPVIGLDCAGCRSLVNRAELSVAPSHSDEADKAHPV